LLVEQEVITAQELAMVIGLQLNIPRINLNTYQIQTEALRMIPETMARKYIVIPLAIYDNTLQVAMAEADNVLIIEELTALTRQSIATVYSPLI